MARLIPAVKPSDLKSPGESLLFDIFSRDASMADWRVIHSLDLPDHVRQVSGEADFVVIAPERGILVVEVKGVNSVRREAGLWTLGHHAPPEARGPFRQAADEMHSLRNRLLERLPKSRGVLMWWCVVFPFIRFDLPAVEWHEWEVVDAGDLETIGIKGAFERVFAGARELLSTRTKDALSAPGDQLADEIVAVLRQDFEVYEVPRARLARLDAEVLRYTQEQFAALDAMSLNERVLFDGAAGTGKTVLATEAARREALSGRRTLLLCFNRPLARWMERELYGISGLEVSGLHSKLLSVAGADARDDPRFWEDELPLRAAEALLAASDEYDALIVDETQDLLRGPYFDCVDLMLRGGLQSGRWRCFGDFVGQHLYGASTAVESLLARARATYANFHLSVNCRNTPRIAALAGRLADVPDCYAHVLRGDDGVDPIIEIFATDNEQLDLLTRHLGRLRDEGFRGEAVAILSTRGTQAIANKLQPPWSDRLGPIEPAAAGRSRSGTIHSFKGLEAAAVVLTDIESLTSLPDRTLVYVGCTRARHRLVVLAAASVVPMVEQIVIGRRQPQ